MAAVPIYVWNGSAWQETGPTIPANPIKYQASAPSSPSTGDIWVDSDGDVTTGSQQFQRFRFVASGGETTISGADANGAVLAYTAGLEQVVLNGAVLVRGHDYTATNGTSITGLSPALVASDVLEVFSFIAFTVANTYTQSQVDGLINAKGKVLLSTTTLSTGTTSVSSINQDYTDLEVVMYGISASTAMSINFNINGTTSNYYGSGYRHGNGFAAAFTSYQNNTTIQMNQGSTVASGNTSNIWVVKINNYASTAMTKLVTGNFNFYSGTDYVTTSQVGMWNSTSAVSSFTVTTSTGTFSGGTVLVYGVK